MNRSDIRTAITERLAIPSIGDGLLPAATLNLIIDRSLSTISAARDWPWLLTSASIYFSPSSATIPSDFIRSRQLTYGGNPVQWINLEDYLDSDRLDTTYGWTIIGQTAYLSPAPTASANGVLYYYRNEPSLTSDTSIPLMPTAHHPLIVAHASHSAAQVRQDESRASIYFAEYTNILNGMKDDLKQNSGRRIQTSRVRRYSTWS